MEYVVANTDCINPGLYSTEWEKAKVGFVDKESWLDEFFPTPETTFKLLKGPEGISVFMHTCENNLRSNEREENGSVCLDSCMEFFFKPSPWDTRYLNFEVNPDGIMHIGIGSSRYKRTLIFDDRKIFDVESDAKDGDWSLKYYIPNTFIEKWYPDIQVLSRGNATNVTKGNFYKCAYGKSHPHLASWAKIETKIEDFHIPDFFGKIIFSNCKCFSEKSEV